MINEKNIRKVTKNNNKTFSVIAMDAGMRDAIGDFPPQLWLYSGHGYA